MNNPLKAKQKQKRMDEKKIQRGPKKFDYLRYKYFLITKFFQSGYIHNIVRTSLDKNIVISSTISSVIS